MNAKVIRKWFSDPHRPPSCGAARKGSVEALTGGRAGRVFSRVRQLLRDADAVRRSGRPHRVHRYREVCRVPRGQRPRARTQTPRSGTGRSHVRPRQRLPWDVSGSVRTYADDERTWEVGQPHSTYEVPEQRRTTGGGGWRGRGLAKGDPRTSKTRPGLRAGATRSVRWSGYVERQERIRRGPVHSASAPHLQPGNTAHGLFPIEEGSRARCGRGDVAALRRATGGESPRESFRKAEARSVSSEAGG